MTRLILMGAPGAGKGTQAKLIAGGLSVPAISTGDIFRRNVKEETPLGVEARGFLEAGDYVPDEVTNSMVRERIAEDDARRGFLLDGYPRTLSQVEALDKMLDEAGHRLDAVVMLTVAEEVLVDRLLKRAEHEARDDDDEQVARHRQELFRKATEPLLSVYEDRGLLVRVDGVGGVDEVSARVMAELERLGADSSR